MHDETMDYPDPTETAGIFYIVMPFSGWLFLFKNGDFDVLSQEKNLEHRSAGTMLFTLSQTQWLCFLGKEG